jgi:hypothetical protein
LQDWTAPRLLRTKDAALHLRAFQKCEAEKWRPIIKAASIKRSGSFRDAQSADPE